MIFTSVKISIKEVLLLEGQIELLPFQYPFKAGLF